MKRTLCVSFLQSYKRSSTFSTPVTLLGALRVLGLNPATLSGREFTHKALKKAYIAQTLKCHPDLFPGDEDAHAKFQQLQDSLEMALKSNSVVCGDLKDSSDLRMSFAEQLRLVVEAYTNVKKDLEERTASPNAASPREGVSPPQSVSLGEVVDVCSSEFEALATINRFRTSLAKTLSGDSFTLFDTFVLYHPQYVKAMSKCVLRFSRDLPVIVRRVVLHRRKHISSTGLQKGSLKDRSGAQRYRQGIAVGRGTAASASMETAGGTNDTIDTMPMKPLVLVGALVFAHPKMKSNLSVEPEPTEERVVRAQGPHAISDIQCTKDLVCIIHPEDSIDVIVAKIGAWEGRSYERLRVELAMVQSAKTLCHLLGMSSVSFSIHHQLYRTTADTVLASLTMQRLVCLLSGIVGVEGPESPVSDPLTEGGVGAELDEEGMEQVIRSMLMEIALAQAAGSLVDAMGGGRRTGHTPQITLLWHPPKPRQQKSSDAESTAAREEANPSSPEPEEALIRSMDEFLPEEELLSATYHNITAREIAHEHAWLRYQQHAKLSHVDAEVGADKRSTAPPADQLLGTPKEYLESGKLRTYASVERDHAACDATTIRYSVGVELHKNPIRFLRSVLLAQREVLARAKSSRDSLGPIMSLRKQLESEEFIPVGKKKVDRDDGEQRPTEEETLAKPHESQPRHEAIADSTLPPSFSMPPIDHPTIGDSKSIFFSHKANSGTTEAKEEGESVDPTFDQYSEAYPLDEDADLSKEGLTLEQLMERETLQRLRRASKVLKGMGMTDVEADVMVDDTAGAAEWGGQPEDTAASRRAEIRQAFETDAREIQWGRDASPDFVRFHPGTDTTTEYAHRPAVRIVSRTFGMEGPTELVLWKRLYDSRLQLATLAPTMNALNIHFGRIDNGGEAQRREEKDPQQVEEKTEEEVSGWYGEGPDGDKVIVTRAVLDDPSLFSLWLQDIAEQSSLSRAAIKALQQHRIHYIQRDPKLPLTQYLSFVKVFCGAEAARATIESKAAVVDRHQPLTPDVVGFSIIVGSETAIRDGGCLVIPWYADPATLVALLSERSITLELEAL